MDSFNIPEDTEMISQEFKSNDGLSKKNTAKILIQSNNCNKPK